MEVTILGTGSIYSKSNCASLIIDNKFFVVNKHIFRIKKVIHTGIDSYGFIVDSKLGISGDTSLCDGVFSESKILICDCSLINGDVCHMEIDNIIELLKNNKEKKIILTHFRDSTKEIAQSMSLDNVYIVDDGYKFVLEV